MLSRYITIKLSDSQITFFQRGNQNDKVKLMALIEFMERVTIRS